MTQPQPQPQPQPHSHAAQGAVLCQGVPPSLPHPDGGHRLTLQPLQVRPRGQNTPRDSQGDSRSKAPARILKFTLLQSTLHTAHCTLHTAHCTLHTAYCTLHTFTPQVEDDFQSLPLETLLEPSYSQVFLKLCTLHTTNRTLHTTNRTLHTTNCTLHLNITHYKLHTCELHPGHQLIIGVNSSICRKFKDSRREWDILFVVVVYINILFTYRE